MRAISQIKKISLVTVVIGIVFGILFIAFPEKLITYISLLIGVAIIVIGVAGIVNYLIDKASKISLAMGIILTISGIVICARYRQIISIIVILVGIFLLCTGVFNFFTSIKVIASSLVFGWASFALSVATVALGIICITRSQDTSNFIAQLIGVSLLVYSVLDIITYIQVKKLVKRVNNAVESTQDIETDGSIVEETDE